MAYQEAQKVVLLLHGIYDNSKDFAAMEKFLQNEGFETHALDLKPSDGKVAIEVLAQQVADYVEANLAKAPKFDVIGFSMGSLVARYYIQKLGGKARVERFVIISGPNKGSPWAYFFQRPGFKQMRPKSDFLKELNKNLDELKGVKTLCLFTPLDVTVPAAGTILPEIPHRKVWVLAHPLMMESKKVFRLIGDFLK